ncbi:sentan-like [Pristis pectinata]|uniref:sentan-like n=1 Tax=Pristis pectinata TaxID=685728 RepID=UPI00223D13A9|nr:sentan-like [Pristis pectinata]
MIKKFKDGSTTIYVIDSKEKSFRMQENIDSLVNWAEYQQVKFNPEKCQGRDLFNVCSRRTSVEKQLAPVKVLRKSTDLEKSVATIAIIFNNHTGPDGKLSKAQAKDLLSTQFQSFIKGQELKPKYKEIMSDLDEDKDRRMDFEDFMILLTSLTIMSDLMHELRSVTVKKMTLL